MSIFPTGHFYWSFQLVVLLVIFFKGDPPAERARKEGEGELRPYFKTNLQPMLRNRAQAVVPFPLAR